MKRKSTDHGEMNPWSILKDMIHGVSVVLEVVDARDIPGTRLPLAEKWTGSKRLFMIVNKADLLPPGTILPKLQNKGMYVSAKSTDENVRMGLIRAIIARTDVRPVKALLVGYPNVGKSTLINMLARKKVTRVSAVAGTTKSMQWIRINEDLILTDYRGMFPKYEKKDELVRKSALNVQGDEEKYAYKFAEKVLKSAKLRKWLEDKFGITLEGVTDSEGVLGKIAERRKWYLKGGELNLHESAKVLVRVMAEAPEM
ncbi:MAG: GTPase [Candidatus Micrarchaeota archaeon]